MIDYRHWNTLVFAFAIFILSLVLGFALGATFSVGCTKISDAPFGCFEWWLSRYQTLIAMIGAFVVAGVAADQVWRQLKLSSVQTTVTMHQVLSAREKILQSRAKEEMARLDQFVNDFARDYYEREGDGSLGHWLYEQDMKIAELHKYLSERQSENLDGDETAIERQNLLRELSGLAKSTNDFNGTVHAEQAEIQITPEIEAQIREEERQAAADLPHRIDDVTKATYKLKEAFDSDVAEIRSKRQLIDQVLASAEIA